MADTYSVAKSSGNIRRDRIRKARARIAAGHYDNDTVLDIMMSARRLDRILCALDVCPVGQGHLYRDLVAESLSKILGGIVDPSLSRTEIPASGGRVDIELPLRTESLNAFPLWNRWADRYQIRSILVETKNEKAQASVEDVSQLAGYLDATNLSQFGILVARNGFSKNAIQNIACMARHGKRLIIPLDHHQLRELGRASRAGATSSMQYLRRQETLLLQGDRVTVSSPNRHK